jgi:hypothetical protein
VKWKTCLLIISVLQRFMVAFTCLESEHRSFLLLSTLVLELSCAISQVPPAPPSLALGSSGRALA